MSLYSIIVSETNITQFSFPHTNNFLLLLVVLFILSSFTIPTYSIDIHYNRNRQLDIQNAARNVCTICFEEEVAKKKTKNQNTKK